MVYFRMEYDCERDINSIDDAMEYFGEEVNYLDIIAPGIVVDISGAIYMYGGYIGENGIVVFIPGAEDVIFTDKPDAIIDFAGFKYVKCNGLEYLLEEDDEY